MSRSTPPAYWNIPQEQLAGLTCEKARDLILECFFFAQKETFAHAKEKLGMPTSDEEVRKSICTIIKKGFSEISASFDYPTKEAMLRLLELLAVKSRVWGMPREIVDHHRRQIENMLRRLPDDIPF
jgi:hypothetical protein